MKLLRHLTHIVSIFSFLILVACGGGGGTSGPTDNSGNTITAASYEGIWDITISNLTCDSIFVNETVLMQDSITQDADGNMSLWIVDTTVQEITGTISGANASWSGQNVSLEVNGIPATVNSDASLTISGDNITGTISYTNAFCSNTANFTATRVDSLAAPVVPTGLVVSNVSSTTLDLSWTDNASDETGYRISRMGPGNTDYVEIAVVGADVTGYQDTGLAESTLYNYSVVAYNNIGESAAATANRVTGSTSTPTLAGIMSTLESDVLSMNTTFVVDPANPLINVNNGIDYSYSADFIGFAFCIPGNFYIAPDISLKTGTTTVYGCDNSLSLDYTSSVSSSITVTMTVPAFYFDFSGTYTLLIGSTDFDGYASANNVSVTTTLSVVDNGDGTYKIDVTTPPPVTISYSTMDIVSDDAWVNTAIGLAEMSGLDELYIISFVENQLSINLQELLNTSGDFVF